MPFGKLDALVDQSNYADQIFQRYQETITNFAFGHSHLDEIEIGYSDYNNRTADTANLVSYMGGAVTPRSESFPSCYDTVRELTGNQRRQSCLSGLRRRS